MGDITNIDISSVAITKMSSKYSKQKPELQWVVMDVCDMKQFKDESFDFVIDKGTLDTLLCSCSSEAAALKANTHIHRVLTAGGTYVNLSYGEPSERTKHFSRPEYSWWSSIRPSAPITSIR